MKNKKKIFLVIVGVIALLVVNCFIYNLFSDKTNFITDYDYLYDVAIDYLKNNNEDDYYKNNEDYQLLISYDGFGISEDKDYKYAYMWILEESYYVKNGKLYSGSGSSMAYKFTFKDNKVLKYEIPEDGSYYSSSITKIFPKKVAKKILNYNYDLKAEQTKKIKEHYSYLKTTEINYESSYKYNEFSLDLKNECNSEVKEYYKANKRTIYLVCANEFYIKDLMSNDNKITFNNYISSTRQTFDDSIKKLTDELDERDSYDDGGTTIYKNNDITVIKCNTLDGNKDIYIGDNNLTYRETYCK